MRRIFLLTGMVVVLVVFGSLPGLAQPSEDMKALRKDVDALKEGQKAIQSDLQEIKTLLRARPAAAAPAAAPLEAVLSLDGAPVKGEKSAKVALVDFTDYQ